MVRGSEEERGRMSSSLERARREPLTNLVAGGVGGLASLLVGHPFDTVKVG